MEDRERLLAFLMDLIGPEGCGVACSDAQLFADEDGWKLMLEGFMEPWKLGRTVDEAQATLKELADMRFGLHG